jgi:hypothetical protein
MPYWLHYRPLLRRIGGGDFPGADRLNRLLPPGTVNFQGQSIRFVPDCVLGPVDYEAHIYRTGQVSTRRHSWHDLFNALVWCRFPGLKMAMNALHFRHLEAGSGGRRGRRRDALTLLDESGMIVVSDDREALSALARRDWAAAFRHRPSLWGETLRPLICGHALLEKFLDPYKAITAHALLVYAQRKDWDEDPLGYVDGSLSRLLLDEALMDSSAWLSPIPLMGIPGWWPAAGQDETFYRDSGVFRIPAGAFEPGPVIDTSTAGNFRP